MLQLYEFDFIYSKYIKESTLSRIVCKKDSFQIIKNTVPNEIIIYPSTMLQKY